MSIDQLLEEGDLVPRAEEYRRKRETSVLAIVFTDIANSTALREELGERCYEDNREAYDEQFTRIVEQGGDGIVVKSTGDGALAVFSEPSTAVERCLRVQKELGGHPHFKTRIGIDMGQVSVKSSQGIVRDVFGRHVNRAARIESLAEPGHILTSFHVYDCAVGWLKGPNIQWRNHGVKELKGFDDPVSVHEVYDPIESSPQAMKQIAVTDLPMFSRAAPRFRSIKLTETEWADLYEQQREQPLTVCPPSLSYSDDPVQNFELSIESVVHRLKELVPEQPLILWVDDFPENNKAEHRLLLAAGCGVDIATSTAEAQRLLGEKRYFLAITDMGRENDPVAGLTLLNWCKKLQLSVPIILYASSRAVAKFDNEAKEAGAVLCTAGVVSLLDGIEQILDGLLRRIPVEPIEEEIEPVSAIKSKFISQIAKMLGRN